MMRFAFLVWPHDRDACAVSVSTYRWFSARLRYLHWRYHSLALSHRYQQAASGWCPSPWSCCSVSPRRARSGPLSTEHVLDRATADLGGRQTSQTPQLSYQHHQNAMMAHTKTTHQTLHILSYFVTHINKHYQYRLPHQKIWPNVQF